MLLITGLEILLIKGLPWAAKVVASHFVPFVHAYGWLGTLKITCALGITARGVIWTQEMVEQLQKAFEKMGKGDISGAGDALSVVAQAMGIYEVATHKQLFLDKIREYLQKSGNNTEDTQKLVSGLAEVLQSTKSWNG